MNPWKPIAGVPKDGTVVDLWHKNGFREHDEWWDDTEGCFACLLPIEDFTHYCNIVYPDGTVIS